MNFPYLLRRASRPVMDQLEGRQMLSASAPVAPHPLIPMGPRAPAEEMAVAHGFDFKLPSWSDAVSLASSIGGAFVDLIDWAKNKAGRIYDKIKVAGGAIKTTYDAFVTFIQALGNAAVKIIDVLSEISPKAARLFVDAGNAARKRGLPFRDQLFAATTAAIKKGGATALQYIRAAEFVSRERDTSDLHQSSTPTKYKKFGALKYRTSEFRNTAGQLFVIHRWVLNGKAASYALRVG